MRTARILVPLAAICMILSTSQTFSAIPRAQRATGNTSTSQTTVAVTIYAAPDGNDANDGSSPANAVKTVKRAVALAQSPLQQGRATKIAIANGIYREGGIAINGTQIGGSAKTTLLIIEGAEKGKVIISGSTSAGWGASTWKLNSTDSLIYEHAWPYTWGQSGMPKGENSTWYGEFMRRREMLVYNGILLKQVLAYINLVPHDRQRFWDYPGTYYVNETERKIYIRMRQPMAPADSFEVPQQEFLLTVDAKENFVLRNIIFKHSNPYIWQNNIWGRAFACSPNGANVLIEDCDFVYNNAGGGDMVLANASTWRRCTFSSNGWKGAGMSSNDNVLIESSRADSNSWRQFWQKHTGLDAAGIKFCLSNRITVTRYNSEGGTSEGLWYDYDNKNITCDQCTIKTSSPILLEANPGPVTITKSLLNSVGVVGTQSVVFDSCTMTRGFLFSDQNFRNVNGWQAVNQNWGVYHCTVNLWGPAYSWDPASTDPDIWGRFFRTLESDYNQWQWDSRYLYRGDTLFFNANKQKITFAQWQALGKDVHSRFMGVVTNVSHPQTAPAPRSRTAPPSIYTPRGQRIVIRGGAGMPDILPAAPHGVYLIERKSGFERRLVAEAVR